MKQRFRWRTITSLIFILISLSLLDQGSGSLTLQKQETGRHTRSVEVNGPHFDDSSEPLQFESSNSNHNRRKREVTAPTTTNDSVQHVKNYTVSN